MLEVVVAVVSMLRNRRISGMAKKNMVAHDAAITDMLSSSFNVIAVTLLELVLTINYATFLPNNC